MAFAAAAMGQTNTGGAVPYYPNKGTGSVSGVTATPPLTSSGGAAPVIACATCGVTSSPLNQFATTTSAQLASILSDETGTGSVVFSASPALTGTPTAPTQSCASNTDIATGAYVANCASATDVSTSTSTATGSSTARTQAKRNADIFNVRDYGALGTNTGTAIGTTFGASLSALAAFTTTAGATPFSWATNPLFGLIFSMTTSAAQGGTSTAFPLPFKETITNGWTATVALWQDPANGNYQILPGMAVTGSCIAANTTVASVDRTAGDANYGTVTLSQATSTACASGTAITFTITNAQLQALTLDWLGLQAAVANASLDGLGSKVYVPSGTYLLNHVILNANGAFNGIEFAGDGIDTTYLKFSSDLGTDACGLAEVSRSSNPSNSDYRDFAMLAPSVSLVLGTPPNNMDGLCIGSNAQVHRFSTSYFHAGINGQGNHWSVYDSINNSNFYGIYLAPYTHTVGNQIITNTLYVGNTMASLAVATTNQLDSANITSSGFGFSPYGLYQEANPSTVTSPRGFATNNTFVDVGAEAVGNAWIYSPYSYGLVIGNQFLGGGFLDAGNNATYKLSTDGKTAAINVGQFSQNTMTGTNWSPYSGVTTAIIKATGACNTNMWVNDFNFVSSPTSTVQPFSCTGGASGNRFTGPNGEGTFMYANGGAITTAYVPLKDTGGSQNAPYTVGAPYAGLAASVAGSGNIVGVITYATDLGGVPKASADQAIAGGGFICPGVGGIVGCNGQGAIGTADSTSSSGTTTVSMRLDPALGASVQGGAAVVPYTGVIATRSNVNNSFVSAGPTWMMNRSAHIARQAMPANSVKVLWQNYYVNTVNQETGIGSATFKASIEYPSGTIAGNCTFSNVTQPTIVALADAIADFCPHAAIPNGAMFWVRMLYVNTTGVIFTGLNPSTTQDGNVFGSGTPTDDTLSGTVPAASTLMFMPAAVIGTTTQPSVCFVGDSRALGANDSPNDATLDIGELARWIGPNYGYANLAVFGTNLNVALANFTNRLRIIAYCSHVIDEYGINDIGGGQSSATVVTNRTAMATLVGKPTFGTTLPTETTSTDSWATIGNQTTSGNPSVVATFNSAVRAGISGELNYLDIALALDPLGIGKWPVSQNIFATTGTANFCTTDGVHETPACNKITARALGFTSNWFKR